MIEKNIVKNQKRAKKINNLKSHKIDNQIFQTFVINLQNMSFIYNHYDKKSLMDFNLCKNYTEKVCYNEEIGYFIPIHIFKNDYSYVIGGLFYENEKVLEYEIIVSDLNDIKFTKYNLSDYLLEGVLK